MHIEPRELINAVSETPKHREESTLIFIIALTLLVILGFIFIQHVIPFISTVIGDFLKHTYGAAGGLA